MGWVGKRKLQQQKNKSSIGQKSYNFYFLDTDNKFQFVPKAVFDEAEKYAKESMESDDEEM